MHLLALSKHLRARGVEVVVVYLKHFVRGSQSLRDAFEEAGIRTLDLGAESRWSTGYIRKFEGLVQRERPHLIHTHLPRADVAGAWVRRVRSIPWISSVHGIYSESWSGRRWLPLVRFAWQYADALIAISAAVKDWLATWQSVSPDKVSVVYYGIDIEAFRETPLNLRTEWGLERNKVLGSLGRLEPGKGHDVLIRSMPEVLKAHPDAILVIGGHDPEGYGATLQSLINDLGLQSQVRLVGFQREAAAFLKAVDVFALASRSEGFGQVVIEAMASSLPVVISRIPPLTELVEDGVTGFLVQPNSPVDFGQKVARLLDRPVEAKRLGENGREMVRRRFSASRMADETLGLYTTLVRRAGRRPHKNGP